MQVARILAVRLDNLGDVIMLSPALRSLRRAYPTARLTLMVSPAGRAAAALIPEMDEVFVHRALWQDVRAQMPFAPAREEALIEAIRKRAFDAAFVFTSFSQSPYPAAYVCYLAGVPVRVAQSREFGGGVLTTWVAPLPDDAHQVDRNLHLLAGCGIAIDGSRRMAIAVPGLAREHADALLRYEGVGSDFIALAPGATCSARRYSLERFRDVALALRRLGHRVVVLGGEADREAGEALAAPPGIVSLCGRTDLAMLAAIVARARLLVSNDSGPMHIADAVGCPVVVLYAGTDRESQWRPRSVPARLLRRPTPCAPCYRFTCPYDHECLAIAPAEVVVAVQGLLADSPREAARA